MRALTLVATHGPNVGVGPNQHALRVVTTTASGAAPAEAKEDPPIGPLDHAIGSHVRATDRVRYLLVVMHIVSEPDPFSRFRHPSVLDTTLEPRISACHYMPHVLGYRIAPRYACAQHACIYSYAGTIKNCIRRRDDKKLYTESTHKVSRCGPGMSGRPAAIRGPPAPTLLYPQAERPRQRLR